MSESVADPPLKALLGITEIALCLLMLGVKGENALRIVGGGAVSPVVSTTVR